MAIPLDNIKQGLHESFSEDLTWLQLLISYWIVHWLCLWEASGECWELESRGSCDGWRSELVSNNWDGDDLTAEKLWQPELWVPPHSVPFKVRMVTEWMDVSWGLPVYPVMLMSPEQRAWDSSFIMYRNTPPSILVQMDLFRIYNYSFSLIDTCTRCRWPKSRLGTVHTLQ